MLNNKNLDAWGLSAEIKIGGSPHAKAEVTWDEHYKEAVARDPTIIIITRTNTANGKKLLIHNGLCSLLIEDIW